MVDVRVIFFSRLEIMLIHFFVVVINLIKEVNIVAFKKKRDFNLALKFVIYYRLIC